MLKLGTEADRADIERMAVDFFNASPYHDLGVDHGRVSELVTAFLTADLKDKIVILWTKEKPVGVLAAVAEQNIFNRFRFAGELIWWIDPDHRKTKAAEEMRQAFEYWAKTNGCQTATLVDVMGNLDVYYKRKGYNRRETVYLKRL